MNISLSSDDILKALDSKVKIIQYPDISKYKTIDNLLAPYNRVVILYLTTKNYGHWVCIFKNKNNQIEFFDSYGIKPDNELKFINL